MKKSKFTETQIIKALKENESGRIYQTKHLTYNLYQRMQFYLY